MRPQRKEFEDREVSDDWGKERERWEAANYAAEINIHTFLWERLNCRNNTCSCMWNTNA